MVPRSKGDATTSEAATVTSVSEYLDAVDEYWRRWSRNQYAADIWLRGQANHAWSLTPTALRAPYSGVSEHRYRHDFRLRAPPFLRELVFQPKHDWDWYFAMQHYGVPTRLLDWTESALTALYFAAQEDAGDTAGCVWMLQPKVFNRDLSKLAFVPIFSDVTAAAHLPALWDEKAVIPDAPLAIDPVVNSPRLAAQRGKFTVHGSVDRGIESWSGISRSLAVVTIPADRKGRCRRQLAMAGITESVLFPGLAGLAREVRDLYAIPQDV
jgi:FRG domain